MYDAAAHVAVVDRHCQVPDVKAGDVVGVTSHLLGRPAALNARETRQHRLPVVLHLHAYTADSSHGPRYLVTDRHTAAALARARTMQSSGVGCLRLHQKPWMAATRS